MPATVKRSPRRLLDVLQLPANIFTAQHVHTRTYKQVSSQDTAAIGTSASLWAHLQLVQEVVRLQRAESRAGCMLPINWYRMQHMQLTAFTAGSTQAYVLMTHLWKQVVCVNEYDLRNTAFTCSFVQGMPVLTPACHACR